MPGDNDKKIERQPQNSPRTSNNEIFFLETNDDEPSSSSSSMKSTVKRENGFLNDEGEFHKEFHDADDNGGGGGGHHHDDNKRQRPEPSSSSTQSSSTTANSPSGSGSNTMPIFGITPPNFVSFEEIMKTANEMSRMALVNEIVFNQDFKLERKEDSSSLSKFESTVRETMKKAFWDILEEQLAEQPPNYKQAISLLNEIKETLLLFLMPQHVQLKNEINEILDIDLIKQKVDNGIADFQRYAQYILSVCSRLCCPARDEMIKNLTEIKDMIPLFKGIFELLEVMRLDFANFYIQQFRPHIQLASVEYERGKFKNLIEAHQKYQIDVLEFTTKWIRRNYECLDLSNEMDMKHLFNKVLIASYIDLLRCLNPSFNCYMIKNEQKNESLLEDDYPETLLLIRNRIDSVLEKIFKVTFISSVFVVTFAAIGEPLQSIKDFRMKLKKELEAITSNDEQQKIPLQYLKLDDVKSMLTSIATQVRTSIEKALIDYKAPQSLSGEKLDSLNYQINELSTPGNRIRSVMERRILEFIERVIQSPPSQTAAPIQVPSGLSTFANELIQIASEFTRLVSYNRAVYSPYYTKIITNIAGQTHYIPQNELKSIEKSFYG